MSELITPSLRAYLENKALQQAVDELLQVIGGKTTSAENWEDSRTYSQALLMAATVRASYIETLYEIWERTWGSTGAPQSGDEGFDELTVADMWAEGYVYRRFYTDGPANQAGPSITLGVEMDPDRGLTLYVISWDADDEAQEPGDLADVEGWRRLRPDDELGVETDVVSIKSLLETPEAVIASLQGSADRMITAFLRGR